MKKFVMIAAVAALAACSSEPTPEPTPEATETAAAPTVADMAGNYEFTGPDGTAGTSVIAADGAYTDTVGDMVEKGMVKIEDSKTCFDPEGDDPAQPKRCYATTEPDAEGNFTATADDGTVQKVKKVA